MAGLCSDTGKSGCRSHTCCCHWPALARNKAESQARKALTSRGVGVARRPSPGPSRRRRRRADTSRGARRDGRKPRMMLYCCLVGRRWRNGAVPACPAPQARDPDLSGNARLLLATSAAMGSSQENFSERSSRVPSRRANPSDGSPGLAWVYTCVRNTILV